MKYNDHRTRLSKMIKNSTGYELFIPYEVVKRTFNKSDKIIENEIQKLITRKSKTRREPYFWLLNSNIEYDDAVKLSKDKTARVCPVCRKVHHTDKPSRQFLNCGTDTCTDEINKVKSKRLKESKSKYNFYNAEQQAKRYGISVQEAKEKINSRKSALLKHTKTRVEYWNELGYSDEEARIKVSEHQKSVSPRSKQYWINKGYSNREAIERVSDVQHKNWLNRIHKIMNEFEIQDFDEAVDKFNDLYVYPNFKNTYKYNNDNIEQVIKFQKENSVSTRDLIDLGLNENDAYKWFLRRKWFNPQRLIDKGYTEFEAINIINEKICNISRCGQTSNQANEFFKKFVEHAYTLYNRHTNKLYFSDNEFGKLIPGHSYVWYDFVDTNAMIVIEFNGDIYHANPSKYQANDVPSFRGNTMTAQQLWDRDKIKKDFIEQCGYKYMVVWSSEYSLRPFETLKKLTNEVNRLYESITN